MQKCINDHKCYIFCSSQIADATNMFFITSASFIALENMCAKWCQNMVLLCSTVGRGSLFFTLLAAALIDECEFRRKNIPGALNVF